MKHRDHGDPDGVPRDEELTEGERALLESLPREMIPPTGLEDRVTAALKAEGLLASPRRRPFAQGRRWTAWAAAAAAAVAFFASGVVVGQWNGARGVARAMSGGTGIDAAGQAAQVQEAGSDYVRAVAHLADLAAQGDEGAVAPGREAARVALHAAALELARLSPDDPTLRLVLAVLEDHLRTTATDSTRAPRTTIWF